LIACHLYQYHNLLCIQDYWTKQGILQSFLQSFFLVFQEYLLVLFVHLDPLELREEQPGFREEHLLDPLALRLDLRGFREAQKVEEVESLAQESLCLDQREAQKVYRLVLKES
tara:strand:+ start:264 stop:602 length:339 start_codon:yes stop_codon:yes gene_type:complete